MKRLIVIMTMSIFVQCIPENKEFIVQHIPSVINASDAYPPGYYRDSSLPDKTAYLTFDDGPGDWTDDILTILKNENIKATFFICANWEYSAGGPRNSFREYRNTLIRMVQEGHAVGNHTLDHYNLANVSTEQIAREFDDNQALFTRETGIYYRMTLIRPAHGSPWWLTASDQNRARVGKILRKRGILILWTPHFDSSDSMEWVRGEWYERGPRVYEGNLEFRKKMNRIYTRLVSRADGRGIVILMHDTHPTTKDILPDVIHALKNKGYRFATMEDYVHWRWGTGSADLVDMQNMK